MKQGFRDKTEVVYFNALYVFAPSGYLRHDSSSAFLFSFNDIKVWGIFNNQKLFLPQYPILQWISVANKPKLNRWKTYYTNWLNYYWSRTQYTWRNFDPFALCIMYTVIQYLLYLFGKIAVSGRNSSTQWYWIWTKVLDCFGGSTSVR